MTWTKSELALIEQFQSRSRGHSFEGLAVPLRLAMERVVNRGPNEAEMREFITDLKGHRSKEVDK